VFLKRDGIFPEKDVISPADHIAHKNFIKQALDKN
jgi:hypothetical protein